MIEDEFRVFVSEMSMLLAKMDAVNISKTATEISMISKFTANLSTIHATNTMDDTAIKNQFWDEFEHFIESLDASSDLRRKVVDKQPVPVVWGFWKWLHEDLPLHHGYSDKHVELLQGPSNPSGRHVYKSRPKRINWRIYPVKEGDKIQYYTTVAPICEIDAVCSVPSIKPGMMIYESSRRILNPMLKQKEWQRGLDASRIVSISSFLDDVDNSFSNACMIFAPDNSSIQWEDGGDGIPIRIWIDFQFLVEDQVRGSPYMTDHTTVKDLRPLSIIDGQHRVRGGMRSQRGHELNIPVILFPPKLKNRGAAKYFAEINTLAEPLNVLHELFMRHKFALSSRKEERTYAKYDGTKNTFRDRANRLAYEAAAHINLHQHTAEDPPEFGALFSLIRILEENTNENNYVIAADMWVKHAHKWFMPGGPYPPPPNRGEDREDYFKEAANFFDAFMDVCNEGWGDKKKRWLLWHELQANDGQGKRPYIQYNTSVRSLLVNYPNVVKMVRDSGFSSTVITRNRFKQALRTLGNIDWLDRRLKPYYIGTGEPPWQSLARWMKDALERGEEDPYPVSEVMSEDISSERGKGLLSPVEKGGIDFTQPVYKWPHPNEPLEVVVTRPINARRACEGQLYDLDLNSLNQKAGFKVKSYGKPDSTTFTIHHWNGIDQYPELTFVCTWGTTVDRRVSSRITLVRP